jgi:hypothetical protein
MITIQNFELLALATLLVLAAIAILLIRRISHSVASAPDLNPVTSKKWKIRNSLLHSNPLPASSPL